MKLTRSLDYIKTLQSDELTERIFEIEDKLYERGFLVSAIGDSEAEVHIAFEIYNDQGEDNPYVVIRILSEKYSYKNLDKLEEISDYVNEKIGDALEGMPAELLEASSSVAGQIILLNGRKIY